MEGAFASGISRSNRGDEFPHCWCTMEALQLQHFHPKEDMKVGTDLAEISASQTSTVSQNVGFQGFLTTDINRRIVVGSTIAAVGLILSTRLEFGVSLIDLTAVLSCMKRDRVNFVMLNVDNTKWEQERDEFGVEGIPHFAFIDKDGNEEGNVVGRLPRKYLVENVAALANGETSVLHAWVGGQYSSAESRKAHQVVDPITHG